MPQATWSLHADQARLQLGALAAVIDLRNPQRGLFDITLAGQPVSRQQLLGIHLEPASSLGSAPLLDRYVRGADLITTYAETPFRPVRVQVYWCGTTCVCDGLEIPRIELQALVQTSRLETAPHLGTATELTGGDVRRLTACGNDAFERVESAPGEPASLDPQDGPGCFVFRIPGLRWSYVELIHPADFHHAELTADGATVQLAQRLFGEQLEKGVILRSRLRGLYVPRDRDEVLAARAYADFSAAAPPLTT